MSKAAMKKTWELDAEELMKDLELESKSCQSDFDVLVAVAKVASMRLEKETLMWKQQQQQHRSDHYSEERCYYSVIKIREPNIIDSLKTARVSGGRFDDIDGHGDMRKASTTLFSARQTYHYHYRSMPGTKISTADQEKVSHKTIRLAYPEGVPREEILRRERTLKKPMRYQDFKGEEEEEEEEAEEEEEECKKNNHKNLKNDHKRRVRFEDSDSEGTEEEERVRSKKRRLMSMKKKLGPSRTSSKKAAQCGVMLNNVPLQDMPIELRSRIEEMDGTEVKLVIQKVLQKTDCSSSHGRLSIPLNAVINKDFLENSEKEFLKGVTKDGLNFFQVSLIEPDLGTIDIKFRQWNMKKANNSVSKQYVLNKPWNDVVLRNGLKPNDLIQLWSFRVDGNLCLGLVRLSNMPNEVSSAATRVED